MFIERATFKRFFLAPAERDLIQPAGSVAGNIALRWSAGAGNSWLIYEHSAPPEPASYVAAWSRCVSAQSVDLLGCAGHYFTHPGGIEERVA